MAAATTYRVAVGLLKSDPEVTITLPSDADWDAAKRAACEAAGADPTTHRLLFRGREPPPADTLADLGVRPTAKLVLLETEASKRDRARVAAEAAAEDARLARQRDFQNRARTNPDGDAPGRTPPSESRASESNRTRPSDPAAVARATVSATEAKLCALEEEVAAAERRAAAASGVAGAMDPTPPPDDRTFLYLADRLEKAMVMLDGVDASGDEGVRAARKAAVRFAQALLRRTDDAREGAAHAR